QNAGRATSALMARRDGARIALASSPVEALPGFGVYRRERKRGAGSVAIVFYRSFLLAGDVRPIDALLDRFARDGSGLSVSAYYVPSLKAPGVADWLREEFRRNAPDIIVNTTAFSARAEDARSPLDGAGCPVIQ